jgi:general secretion pathway protein D
MSNPVQVFVKIRQLAILSGLCGALAAADLPLLWQAQEAERAGQVARAWSLYLQASRLNPADRKATAKANSLRRAAMDEAQVRLPGLEPAGASRADSQPDPDLVRPLSAEEMAEVRRLLPPPALELSAKSRAVQIRGSVRQIWEKLLGDCGVGTVFDGDFALTQTHSLWLGEATCREAIYAMETLSRTFLVPIAPSLALVVEDRPEKRRDQERLVAVAVPLPEPITVAEVQEMARAVQQVMEMQRFAIDPTRRVAVIRDRAGKVRTAQAIFEQMLVSRSQVVVDVELMQFTSSRELSVGVGLPTLTQLVNLGGWLGNRPPVSSQFARLGTFGGGFSLFGLGLASAELFASASRGETSVVQRAEIRTTDNAPAEVHIGDRFPVIVSQFTGDTSGAAEGSTIVRPPPQIQFEELGLQLKLTPKIHGAGEVTLQIESEFKVLTGETLNGIPVISTRRYAGQARLRSGEWAMVAGLAATNDSVSYSGIPGLSQLPLAGAAFRRNSRSRTRSELLVVLKPRIVDPGPAHALTQGIWTGTEAKLPPAL